MYELDSEATIEITLFTCTSHTILAEKKNESETERQENWLERNKEEERTKGKARKSENIGLTIHDIIVPWELIKEHEQKLELSNKRCK